MAERYLIVGLGNPGVQYETTRHNIGFMALDTYHRAKKSATSWELKHDALISTYKRGQSKEVFLMKPQTYMNLSGEAMAKFLKQQIGDKAIPLKNCLVVYDDIDLPLGRIRFRPSGSSGTHNGMRSIIENLQTEAIPRLRLGVGAPTNTHILKDYVLEPFLIEEQDIVSQLVTQLVTIFDSWLYEGTQKAMNSYNNLTVSNNIDPVIDNGKEGAQSS